MTSAPVKPQKRPRNYIAEEEAWTGSTPGFSTAFKREPVLTTGRGGVGNKMASGNCLADKD